MNARNASQQDALEPTSGATDLYRRNLNFQQIWIFWVGIFCDARDILCCVGERAFERGDMERELARLVDNSLGFLKVDVIDGLRCR